MSRVVHFEIPTADLATATAFYQSVFGWQMQPWPGNEHYVLVDTGEEGPGINGAILVREGPVVNTVDVPDLDAAKTRVEAAGGEIVVAEQLIPNVGRLAYAKDPDGNLFGMIAPP